MEQYLECLDAHLKMGGIGQNMQHFCLKMLFRNVLIDSLWVELILFDEYALIFLSKKH